MGRPGRLGAKDGRVALVARERASLLLAPVGELPADLDTELHRAIDDTLATRGACFISEISAATGASIDELRDALVDLIWAGRITNDTLEPLRSFRTGTRPKDAQKPWGHRPLVEPPLAFVRDHGDRKADAQTLVLLRRYGIVSRDAAQAEGIAGGFGDLGRVLRAMEESGQVRRGHFVEGLSGAQFAAPGAVDRLRRQRRTASHQCLALATTDLANPFGALLSWPQTRGPLRPSRRAGASVILVAGRPVLYLEGVARRVATFVDADDEALDCAVAALPPWLRMQRKRAVRIADIDGEAARRSSLAPRLEQAGFKREMHGLVFAP